MKKVSLLLAFAALLFTGCGKEQVDSTIGDDKVVVSFSAALSGVTATKAVSDNDGSGVYADRCKLQVWWKGKLFYQDVVEVKNLEAKFDNIVLIKDQTYDFLFWADNTAGDYYVSDTLTRVRMKGNYVGCNDKRDAFYAALAGQTVSATFSQTVKMYRPFAQLNVIATDIPALRAQMTDYDLFLCSVPEKVSFVTNVPTVFDVKTGGLSEPKELTYTTSVYTSTYNTTEGAKNTLSMDYLLAPDTEGNVVEVGFTAKNETSGLSDINYTFSNVPLRRNYRTNIQGSLITVKGTINVDIEPTTIGDINI